MKMRKDLTQLHKEFMAVQEFSVKLSSETLRGYQASFDLLQKLILNITLDMISPEIMTEFFKRLERRERVVGKGQTRKGVKASTVAAYRSKFNKFFEWLIVKGFLEDNPFRGMKYPCVNYDDRKYLKKEEIEKIITAVDFNIPWQSSLVRKRNIAVITLFLCCGLRKGELLNLKLYDIDLERRLLTVQAETSKSKRERVIPMNSLARGKLGDYMEERRRKSYKTPCLFVSSNRDDGLTYDGLKHVIEKISKHSGIDFHAHQLRHTFAVNLINNGCDIAKVKQLMGHKDIRMTMSYLRCLPTKAMRVDVETLTLDNLV